MRSKLVLLLCVSITCSCSDKPNPNVGEDKKSAVADSLHGMIQPTFTDEELHIITHDYTFGKPESGVLGKRDWVPVIIHEMKGYGQSEQFAYESAKLLEQVINSDEFMETVLYTKFWEDGSISTENLYDEIMNAHEVYEKQGTDGVIDLYLRTITLEEDGQYWLDKCEGRTIGIDGGGTGVAAVCANWLQEVTTKNQSQDLAAHFVHEYIHNLGFKHRWSNTKSVPYKIQYIVERLGQHILDGKQLAYDGTMPPTQ